LARELLLGLSPFREKTLEHVVTTKTATIVERKRADEDEKAPRQTRTEYAVSPEDFIRAWQLATSAEEVAAKLKMPKGIVHARASTYRRAGVKLKSMPRTVARTLDVDKLNQLVTELGGGDEHESGGSAPPTTADIVRKLRRPAKVRRPR
jgi:hypothetical protein